MHSEGRIGKNYYEYFIRLQSKMHLRLNNSENESKKRTMILNNA